MEIDSVVYLIDVGPNRLAVLAYLRKHFQWSLGEIKTNIAHLPLKIIEGWGAQIAQPIRDLKNLGAKIRIGD